ncbi:1,4-alpha-glucan branching protein GlgB [Corynebacterium tuberculostearicum]|uniref:1,4-alpha-glucan branching protein GlgB n=1 Tax=Corynebacterium tuberculostearicum TaxID=38304 RepID=UPI0029345E29|nr:1,4-alpha-glucan branching protein GlgB [Corynebacterium tuberculostearicum]MDV2431947.1 1,4-alpha-glucan branching protein GlgB [Corynebacterium tuberculostearicum]
MNIPAADLARLNDCRHHDPHGFYGWHEGTVRTRQPGATAVHVHTPTQSISMDLVDDDIWEAEVGDNCDYRLEISYPEVPTRIVADGYHFLPTIGSLDLHLIGEGRHERLWEVLGANLRSYETEMGSVEGVSFAVWAPNAQGVAVVGDFCGWNPTQYPMRSLGSTGVWEVFVPGIGAGEHYKFALFSHEGRKDKADPLAKRTACPPETDSIVDSTSFAWSDSAWMGKRTGNLDVPMSIYEVHVGSWKVGANYNRLREELIPYLKEHGFTHVELLPVAEHPFGGSWGYQVSGYYSPSARWGSPDEFRELVNALHENGIGVIVDWVPAHFPKDDWALGRFDGQALYEHPDPRRGEQSDWGTYVFDFGRNEVRNFLVANALYWAEEFHIDGLRVDAVASMLYLDYSRDEWLPNQYGGRENLEAMQFLQETNATLNRTHSGVLTIAEESTSWPGVTAPTSENGLGFSLKWNMGWMNDTLEYFQHEPIHRSHHHGELTFSMVYAYSERYVLPFSHDEVVHGKGSLWERMPGDDWNKAAGLRALYGYMFSHPGKNLLFMGQEFGQTTEWAEGHSVDWGNLDGWANEWHRGIKRLVRDINFIYRDTPALWSQDFSQGGFQWVKADDSNNNVLGYVRYGADGSALLAVCNLSGSSIPNYDLWVPYDGEWQMILNTDDAVYEGAGNPLPQHIHVADNLTTLHLPANSVQWYVLEQ